MSSCFVLDLHEINLVHPVNIKKNMTVLSHSKAHTLDVILKQRNQYKKGLSIYQCYSYFYTDVFLTAYNDTEFSVCLRV